MIVKESTVKRWAQEAWDHRQHQFTLPKVRVRKRPRPNSRKKKRDRYWLVLGQRGDRAAQT